MRKLDIDRQYYASIRSFCKDNGIDKVEIDLLIKLAKERQKFIYDNEKMRLLVVELVKAGTYPQKPTSVMKKQGRSILDMGLTWGVLWCCWDEPLTCPNCKGDLRNCKDGPPFKREIGIYDVTQDRTSYFMCPDCKGRIERT